MTDNTADGPDASADETALKETGADQPEPRRTAVPGAGGATAIVAFGQTLEDPWRSLVSIAAPSRMVAVRWLITVLQPAVTLLILELMIKKRGNHEADEAGKKDLEKLQRARSDTIEWIIEILKQRLSGRK